MHNVVNVLNAAESCTLKWLKWLRFVLFVFYHKKFAGLDLALSSLLWVSNSQTALRRRTQAEVDNRYLLPPQGRLEARL